MSDLNNCFNAALDESMRRRNVDWYMSTFDDDSYFWKNGYDGNWIGTTMMMSTFPWDAWLKDFDYGGTWQDAFDRSIEQALHLRDVSPYGIPKRSWGAWWGHEYGACYNAGMGLQLLYSDKYRTEVIDNLEFLMENQSAPFQWGESFDQANSVNDWSRPATDYETWGLSYDKQALLEACVSIKTDGTVIFGRGIPNHWLKQGNTIAWKNVLVNKNKKIDFAIRVEDNAVVLTINGDEPVGSLIIDLPGFRDNIAGVSVDGTETGAYDNSSGKLELPPATRFVNVRLKNKL
jgi:hypothetical protein